MRRCSCSSFHPDGRLLRMAVPIDDYRRREHRPILRADKLDFSTEEAHLTLYGVVVPPRGRCIGGNKHDDRRVSRLLEPLSHPPIQHAVPVRWVAPHHLPGPRYRKAVLVKTRDSRIGGGGGSVNRKPKLSMQWIKHIRRSFPITAGGAGPRRLRGHDEHSAWCPIARRASRRVGYSIHG